VITHHPHGFTDLYKIQVPALAYLMNLLISLNFPPWAWQFFIPMD